MQVRSDGGQTWLPRRFEVDTADWPVGEAALEASLHVRIGRPSAEGVYLEDGKLPEKVEHEARLTLRTPFAVLPKDATQPWFVEDPEADRVAVEAVVAVSPIYVQRPPQGLRHHANSQTSGRPGLLSRCRLNGEVILRAGGREASRKNGEFQFQPSGGNSSSSFGFNVEHWPTASGQGRFVAVAGRRDPAAERGVGEVVGRPGPASGAARS